MENAEVYFEYEYIKSVKLRIFFCEKRMSPVLPP